MGIMILVQNAAVLFLAAASMISALILTGAMKLRGIMPKSKTGIALTAGGIFLFFAVFYTMVIGYKYGFWIFSIEIIDALPAAQSNPQRGAQAF